MPSSGWTAYLIAACAQLVTMPAVFAQSTPAPSAVRPGFWSPPRPSPSGSPVTPQPLSTLGAGSSLQPNAPPSRDIPLVEKKFEDLSNKTISGDGRKALDIAPDKWKHAETDNFILHYRRVTEAQKVAREVEYNLWYVATTLNATKDKYQKKSHVYIFEDEDEWKKYLAVASVPMKWAVSYAWGDELYLNVRGGGNSGSGTSFDSHTLAHETTHAVVARLYPGKHWPLWLNEGFAEYMGGASVAARKGQFAKRYERALQNAEIPLDALTKMTDYPEDPLSIQRLYQTSEKLVRFLMTEGPKDRFPKFIDAILAGKGLEEAVLQIYGDRFKDWPAFAKHYEKFSK